MGRRRRFKRQRGLCILPGYKWCGPGCSGPGAPINYVDACCMAHDECYDYLGIPCICDQLFINCLHSKVNPYSRMGRDALILYSYMKLQKILTCAYLSITYK